MSKEKGFFNFLKRKILGSERTKELDCQDDIPNKEIGNRIYEFCKKSGFAHTDEERSTAFHEKVFQIRGINNMFSPSFEFNGKLSKFIYNKYTPKKEYNILKSALEASPRFKKFDTDQCVNPNGCFCSENGAVFIELDKLDYDDQFPGVMFSMDENDWFTSIFISNVEKSFLDDISSALEAYFGFKVYHSVKTINQLNMLKYIVIFDTDSNEKGIAHINEQNENECLTDLYNGAADVVNEADSAGALSAFQNVRNTRQEQYADKIKGSFIGGAVGDALGYPVEFMSERRILDEYGKDGITEYILRNGVAQISDDTQMSLFTANCVLFAETRLEMRGIGGDPKMYAPAFYLDWLITQEHPYDSDFSASRDIRTHSWLLDVPELFNTRAPGNTCLSALKMRRQGFGDNDYGRYTANPINDSKGCGGIMRIAPLALSCEPFRGNREKFLESLDIDGAEMSAITHGHSLGYMPSAVLTHILNLLVYPSGASMTLKEIIEDARDTVARLYRDDAHIDELKNIINKAIDLSENQLSDAENIRQLGEGWVAEETLAIAIYCSLRHCDSFSDGIIAAVNHGGDSDSTGAVTGNILGALLGLGGIEEKWLNNLELFDVINEMADDLSRGCEMSEYDDYRDEAWIKKYIHGRRV